VDTTERLRRREAAAAAAEWRLKPHIN
jgi:hypothetical protein